MKCHLPLEPNYYWSFYLPATDPLWPCPPWTILLPPACPQIPPSLHSSLLISSTRSPKTGASQFSQPHECPAKALFDIVSSPQQGQLQAQVNTKAHGAKFQGYTKLAHYMGDRAPWNDLGIGFTKIPRPLMNLSTEKGIVAKGIRTLSLFLFLYRLKIFLKKAQSNQFLSAM